MRDRGSEKKRLKDTLNINSDELAPCNITFTSDCLDQTVLNIEFPIDIQREWADDLSGNTKVSWVGDNMFIIDKPCFYRLIGCSGSRDLNVRFRIFNLNPSAWVTIKQTILNILAKNGVTAGSDA